MLLCSADTYGIPDVNHYLQEMLRLVAILFLSVLVLKPSASIGQSFHFQKITEQHGLSDNRVTCFMKDRSGFMWIGTGNGLNRYDGYEFRIYRPGQNQFRLSHEYINDVEEDQQGELWVATWNGLCVIDPKKDSLTVFSPDEGGYSQKKNKLSSSLIWDVYVDNHNRIWLAPDIRDLCYYDKTKREFVYLPWRAFLKKRLPDRNQRYTSVHKIRRKNDNELWIGTTLGLFSYDVNKNTFEYHGGDDPADFVSFHYDSINQRVYFGQKNIYMYSEKTKTLEKINQRKDRTFNFEGVTPLLIACENELWGILPDGRSARRVVATEKIQFSLHHETPPVVFYDSKTLWIGTSDGIRIYDQYLDRFRFTPVFSDTVQTTTANVFHVFDHAANDQLYISSFTGNKLIVIDKKTGDRQNITHISGKRLQKCSRVYEDSKKRLWLLTTNQIFLRDTNSDQFRLFPFPETEDDYLFMDMIEDADGNYWFASLRYGVYFYETKTKNWRLLRHKPDGLFASRPTSLLSDTTHRTVWISDYSFGAFQYNLDTKKFIYHGMDATDPDLLHSSLVNDLALDKDGDVWLATSSGGVSRYSYQENKFKTFSMETGLPENTVEAIETDLNGNLWLASHQGLTNITTEGKIVKHYNNKNGLAFSGFSTPLTRNHNGELIIGIANGFLKFHPDSLQSSTSPFPVVITSVVQGETLIDMTGQNHFPFAQNEFIFHFAALTYTQPQQVTYHYKLEGYDHDWVQAGHDHIAKYTNLNEGEYMFRVKAFDHTGTESSNIASVSFSISPPFWKHWWFIIVILIIFSAVIYLWIRSLQQKIRSQQTLKDFATSLYNKNTIEEVFWDLAQNCITLLKFEDCVVYLLVPERNVLVQKAAAGPKSPTGFKILNPIEIPVGAGIVGTVAETGKAEIVNDTFKDIRYIIDDEKRRSEITVPIIVDGKVFGVIDSEHSQKGFYTRWHLRMLKEVAAICSAKISKYFIEDYIRSKVARDLHDDMGSTLSSIKIMSNIALERKETTLTQQYLRSIRQNATQMQESMSDIVWAINPENDTIEKVIIKMKEFAAEILEPLNIQYEFIERGDFQIMRMDLNTRKDFYLIFKEAVNNAAKYSECSEITIELVRSANALALKIRDNGKGFDPDVKYSGNGLRNIRQRARNIQAKLEMNSCPGKGTTIHLQLGSHD